MPDIPLMAPDMSAQVQQTINEHPEIDTMDEEARGAIIDITDWRVNGGIDRPWGRKARSNDPNNPNLNTDGMTYLRPDGLFEIYDCISGTNGQATWDGYGPFYPGENGWWWPPQPVENQPAPPDDLADRVTTLEGIAVDQGEALEQQQIEINANTDRITRLESLIAQGFHAQGFINVPTVLESLTSLRAKGDIDVNVIPGQAPATESNADDDKKLDPLVLLAWMRQHRSEEGEAD